MSVAEALARDEVVATQGYAGRFGTMLRRHRRARGWRLSDLARRGDRSFDVATLRQVERGRRRLDPALLHQLAALYELDATEVLPDHRSVLIDLERGVLSIGDSSVPLPDLDDPAAHFARYVSLVNRLRARPMRSPATLRREDTVALAEAFELEHDDVTALLAEVIGRDAAARRRLTALKSGGGTLAAVVVLGAAAAAGPPRGEADTEPARGDGAHVVATDADGPDEAAGEPTGGTAGQEPAPVAEATLGQHPPGPVPLPDADEEDPEPADSSPPEETSGQAGSAQAAEPDEAPAAAPGPGEGEATESTQGPTEVDETEVDAGGDPASIERGEGDDETDVDAGEEPPVIEREPETPAIEDETEIDAPGGPVVIEREEP